jgi:hypothetical protein
MREFLAHFAHPLIILLLLVSLVSAFVGEATNAIIIAVIILFSVSLDLLANATFVALSQEGYRVLGIAAREVSAEQQTAFSTADEHELIFLGFAAFLDPPKKSATATLHALHRDGIEVKVLTGDNEIVTRKICRRRKGLTRRRKKFGQPGLNLIPHAPKHRQPFFVAAFRRCRVSKAVMKRVRARPDGTGGLGVVADSQHIVEGLAGEFSYGFGVVQREVNAFLVHRRDRQRIDLRRMRAGAEDSDAVAGHFAQPSFGHLTARGIAGAKNQDSFG